MKNKKITFLIGSLAGGGAEGVCINIANALVQDDWQVDLVVLNLKNAAYKERVSNKVNLVNLNVSNVRYSFLTIKKYIKENKVEKMLVFNYELAVMLVLIRKLSFIKFKIIARNINTDVSLRKKLDIGLKQEIYKNYEDNIRKLSTLLEIDLLEKWKLTNDRNNNLIKEGN